MRGFLIMGLILISVLGWFWFSIGIDMSHSFQELAMFEDIAAIDSRINSIPAPKQYQRIVYEASQKYAIDPQLIVSVIEVESSWRSSVRSHQGAVGLMQILPSTAALFGYTGDLRDPKSNIDIGCRILSYEIEALGIEAGLAAYNGGRRAGNLWAAMNWEEIPKETINYVPRVLAYYE